MASAREARDPPTPVGSDPRKPTIKLTEEERRVLNECNVESLWYRCIPFSVGMLAATQYAARKGYIVPNPRYGLLFKNLGCCLAGYILGKLSYQGKCRDKLLALPNSRLAEAIRMKKSGLELFSEKGAESNEPSPESNLQVRDEFRSSMDMDTESRLTPKGLDDTYRPTMDSDSYIRKEEKPVEAVVTYEELRRQNRESHGKQVPSPDLNYGQSQEMPRTRPPPARKPAFFADREQDKNKYGDVWESES